MAGRIPADNQPADPSAVMDVEDDINSALRKTLLAYQAWHETPDCDLRKTRQTHLDQTLDRMDADDWDGMKTLAGLVDPKVLVGLMHYSAKRADEDLKERIAMIATEKDQSKQKAAKRNRER